MCLQFCGMFDPKRIAPKCVISVFAGLLFWSLIGVSLFVLVSLCRLKYVFYECLIHEFTRISVTTERRNCDTDPIVDRPTHRIVCGSNVTYKNAQHVENRSTIVATFLAIASTVASYCMLHMWSNRCVAN